MGAVVKARKCCECNRRLQKGAVVLELNGLRLCVECFDRAMREAATR